MLYFHYYSVQDIWKTKHNELNNNKNAACENMQDAVEIKI